MGYEPLTRWAAAQVPFFHIRPEVIFFEAVDRAARSSVLDMTWLKTIDSGNLPDQCYIKSLK